MLEFPSWKKWLIVLTLVAGVWFAMPNLFPERQVAGWPGWLPSKQLNLGLDLRGGSHLLLEVDTPSVIERRVESLEEEVRTILRDLRKEQGGQFGYGDFKLEGQAVSFRMTNPTSVDAAVDALRQIAQPIGGNVSGQRDIEVSVRDDTRVVVEVTQAGLDDKINLAVTQSIETVRRRIDEMGTREPTIIRQGDNRIVVQVPGLQDPKQLKDLLGRVAKLEFKMVNTEVQLEALERGRVPPGSEILPMMDSETTGEPPIAVFRRVIIAGNQLVDSRPSFDQNGEPVVSFRFDTSGARRFADVTRSNVGKPFAIILDDEVISAPRINEPILGGSGIISGSFTVESANNLAILLRSGETAAKLNILEERTVGPDLGADSIRAGQIAGIGGIILVCIVMIATYGRFGVYSVIVLGLNIILILAILTVTGATLTLPGIAGLVLTMGAAVDANVLVYERIREELRNGRTPLNAIDTGYKEASRAIWDANMTNLIAALAMFWFGSGPIKGFAIVLSVGIVTSIFTAVTVCRLITVLWLRRARPKLLVI